MRVEIFVLFSVLSVTLSSQVIFKLTPDFVQAGLKAGVKCIVETGAPPEIWSSFVKENFELSEDGKKFLLCVGIATNYANEDGTPNVSKIIETIDEPEFKNAVEKCAPEAKGDTPVEAFYSFVKCGKENVSIAVTI